MRSHNTEIEALFLAWAARRRALLKLPEPTSKLAAGEAVAQLHGALKNPHGDAAAYRGTAALVHEAFGALPVEARKVVELHFLYPHIPVRVKARLFDMHTATFYDEILKARSFVQAYMASAATAQSAHVPEMRRVPPASVDAGGRSAARTVGISA